uniref:Uncharacterized protein n=1 Tax=Yangshan Harbor Nitrososphaeria virus TaxID=2969597 RepID=A0A976YFB1_9CAUD|nr:hypothetical protein [Yangshan Harbor Nitrososphaeria virus]
MPFLDTNKKVWIIKDLEIPVIENTPMKEMKWFRDKVKWAAEREEQGDIKQSEALAVDEEWWERTCQVGLGKSMDDVLDTGISEPEFRDLMAEVYNFLATLGTIEKAKRFVLYDPKIQKKDIKLTQTTQN